MKTFALLVKYVIAPVSTIAALFVGVDTYFIGRASTVVEPVKVKVNVLEDHYKIHQERVERELMMIRSTQEETNRYLRKQ